MPPIKDMQNFLLETLSRAGVGVAILDSEGRVLKANPHLEKITGLSPENISGKFFDEFLNQPLIKGSINLNTVMAERRIYKPGSTEDFFVFKIKIIKDVEFPETGYALLYDVTDYVTQEDAFWDALKEIHDIQLIQSRLLSNVNHELRTPINSILGMTHLLLDSNISIQTRDRLTKIKMSAHHLLLIIDDIIGLKEYESHDDIIINTEFDIDSVLFETLPLPMANLASDRVSFNLYRNPAIPGRLIGPVSILGRIIQSLVGNAVKYTVEGNIELSVNLDDWKDPEEQADLIVRVEDTGTGIKEEYLPHIFTPFSQEDMTSTRKFGGLGLGLAVARNLARSAGGDIEVKSAPGKGSIFSLRIPVDPVPMENEALKYLREKKPGIILIDHGKRIDRIVKEYLEFAGLTILFKNCKDELCEILSREKIDAIICVFARKESEETNFLKIIHECTYKKNTHVLLWEVDKFVDLTPGTANQSILRIQGPILPGNLYERLHLLLRYGFRKSAGLPRFKDASVLIVEDNLINQEVVGGMLQKQGIHTTYVQSGESALNMLETVDTHEFDLILMDIQMPGLSGIETCSRIRNSEKTYKTVPIVALTANTDSAERKTCLQVGMQDYLLKPINPQVLFHTLADLIPNRVVGMDENGDSASPEGQLNAGKKRVNLNDGFERTFQDNELFKRVIDQFRTGYLNFTTDIYRMLEAGDLEDGMRFAHSLKGVASNLGMYELQDLAMQLEMILNGKEKGDLEVLITRMGIALDHVYRAIDEWFDMKTSSGEGTEESGKDARELMEVLEQIKKAITENDVGTLDIMEAVDTKLFSGPLPEYWDDLKESVIRFDFERARGIMDVIQSTL